MRKRGVLAAMLTGVMLVLCGCGGMTTDEAKDYVKSALDAGYKAEFKEYAEITDSTEKEAKKEYSPNQPFLNSNSFTFLNTLAISSVNGLSESANC